MSAQPARGRPIISFFRLLETGKKKRKHRQNISRAETFVKRRFCDRGHSEKIGLDNLRSPW